MPKIETLMSYDRKCRLSVFKVLKSSNDLQKTKSLPKIKQKLVLTNLKNQIKEQLHSPHLHFSRICPSVYLAMNPRMIYIIL